MSTAKEQIKQIIERQPDDSSYDEIMKELAFKRMIDRGLADVEAGNSLSNEEMRRKLQSWQK